jgi:hypothetical protein
MVGSRRTAARDARRDIFEELQPFHADAVFKIGKAGGIAAWPRQALDEAGTDRIRGQREYDRHGAGCLEQRAHGHAAGCKNGVRRERHQFRGVTANALGIAHAPADVDLQVATVGPTQLLEPLNERCHAGLCFRIVRGERREHADPPHALGLLSPRRERPRHHRTAEQRDELATLQLTKLHLLPLSQGDSITDCRGPVRGMPQCGISDGRNAALGRGCVKTCTGQECAESFSLFPSPDGGCQRCWF